MTENKQLELSVQELEAIGFKGHYAPADTVDGAYNPARVWYSIPVTNGEFIYNVDNAPYKWYFRNNNGEGSNNHWLDITHVAAVYTLLQSFKAKFNLIIF